MHSFVGDALLLTASFDHCYYHNFEVYFRRVAYIGLPTYRLDSPIFSMAKDPVRRSYAHLELNTEDILFEIHHAPDDRGGHRYYVAACEIELIEGTVYYYHREGLKPGERIADWVRNGG